MKAIVLGATGLVGNSLVEQLIKDKSFSKIRLFTRRNTQFKSSKIEETIMDFDNMSAVKKEIKGDVLFSAFGTTIGTAGSKDAQYKIDFTYQYEFAKLTASNKVKNYVLISSSGANSKSKFFYMKMKGELEEAVTKLKFNKVIILQPGPLTGDRKEVRIGEIIGIPIIRALSLIPFMKKYKPIHSKIVAKAMINSLEDKSQSKPIRFSLEELFELAKRID